MICQFLEWLVGGWYTCQQLLPGVIWWSTPVVIVVFVATMLGLSRP